MLRHASHRLTATKATAFAAFALGLLAIFAAAPRTARAQTLDFERQRGRMMLETIKDDIKSNYYDPKFRGIDLDARFKKAEEEIKAAKDVGQIVAAIAQALLDFHDSHTYYIPPQRVFKVEYGWRMQMIGDKCYVSAVKPGSDAAAKGLKEGDLLLSVNGFKPTRDSMWILDYYYKALSPQPQVQLVAQSPDGKVRSLDVQAKVEERRQIVGADIYAMIREDEMEAYRRRHTLEEFGTDVTIWKMPEFDLSKDKIDEAMGKVKKRKALILDLRGNGGGSEITMLRLLGHLFDHDVKVGDIKTRQESKPIVAKTLGADNFKGKVVVLIDSNSASASEVVARVVQLEKRGTVVGDRSAGAVMRGRHIPHQQGQGHGTVLDYGVSVTDADLIMTDGKSLEGTGVVPDTIILPGPGDLAAKRDPVLSHAASLVGLELSAEKAGTLFPIEWN
jgi:carboxyl-terminal processing protease